MDTLARLPLGGREKMGLGACPCLPDCTAWGTDTSPPLPISLPFELATGCDQILKDPP